MKWFNSHFLSRHLKLWHELAHHNVVLSMMRKRIFITGCLLVLAYFVTCGRLIEIMLLSDKKKTIYQGLEEDFSENIRADIIERNGEIIATDLVTASLYANPKLIIDSKEVVQKLTFYFPNIDSNTLYRRVTDNSKSFVRLLRHVPPKLQNSIHQLGIPGLYLCKDYKRVYPFGHLTSHILGYCGIDRDGLAGIEKTFDAYLWQKQEPLKLSIDIRVQHLIYQKLLEGIKVYSAKAGNAVIIDIKTGEIIAMVSIPDFDPNKPEDSTKECMFNRNTLGVYEPGSVFKIINTAIALESGGMTLNTSFDARMPIQIEHFTIKDFVKNNNRILTLREAFIYSSNIASVKVALAFGQKLQKKYFEQFGILSPISLEVPEVGAPLIPKQWTDITTMTLSYGYGMSLSPIHLLSIVSGIINNGLLPKVTLLCSLANKEIGRRIISEKTSKIIKDLMRQAVTEGTVRKANIEDCEVFGKSGTAHPVKNHVYQKNKRTTFFVGGFPFNKPKYMILVMLDDPKATKETFGFAAAGWNVVPLSGQIMERILPILQKEFHA
ncbi:MAG: peptidoglycan D,D-transpeptidase FtsI family protein [Alphaproteobacteria bacterium]